MCGGGGEGERAATSGHGQPFSSSSSSQGLACKDEFFPQNMQTAVGGHDKTHCSSSSKAGVCMNRMQEVGMGMHMAAAAMGAHAKFDSFPMIIWLLGLSRLPVYSGKDAFISRAQSP